MTSSTTPVGFASGSTVTGRRGMTDETAEQRLRRIAIRAPPSRRTRARWATLAGHPGAGPEDVRAERLPERDDLEDDYEDEDYEDEGDSGTFLQNVWGGVKEILIIAVMALVLSFIVEDLADPGVLHPLRLHGEHPGPRRPGHRQRS